MSNKESTKINSLHTSTLGNEGVAIIYNVTIKVDAGIADAWLQWLLQENIPEIMSTGCFMNNRVVKLLETDDSEGPTYAIQYGAISKADYNRYIDKYAPLLRQQSIDKWGDGFFAFSSIMEVIQ